MSTPIRILGISGSLRQRSFNTALLQAATTRVGNEVMLDVATLHGIPLYDGDLEQAEGIPPAVVALKDRILASDGLLLSTPEYNNGIPGVFKNAIDWLSRVPVGTTKLFSDRPVAVIGASPGGFGTILAQNAWTPVLRSLAVRQWAGGRLMVSRAGKVFDEGGLVDEAVGMQLSEFVSGFAAFVRSNRAA